MLLLECSESYDCIRILVMSTEKSRHGKSLDVSCFEGSIVCSKEEVLIDHEVLGAPEADYLITRMADR
jgi:hypothetical protein